MECLESLRRLAQQAYCIEFMESRTHASKSEVAALWEEPKGVRAEPGKQTCRMQELA